MRSLMRNLPCRSHISDSILITLSQIDTGASMIADSQNTQVKNILHIIFWVGGLEQHH